MYAPAQRTHVYAIQLRWLARTTAEILVVLWAGYFVAELFKGTMKWPPALFVQGAILAVVFAGYVVAWRKEKIGGWMTILGTAAFVAVLAATQNLPSPAYQIAWFAVPGIMFLVAQHYDRRYVESTS
jgi:hypothetical protein